MVLGKLQNDACPCAGPYRRTLACVALPALFILLSVSFVAPASANDPKERVIVLLDEMESRYAGVKDYTAVFHKQERVEGRLLPEETIFLKFAKPLKVYMKWIEEPLKGTESLYAQGENDNKIIAHRGGMLGALTLSLDPRGSTAMKNNRHPITEIGFGFLLDRMRENVRTAVSHEDLEVVRLEDEQFKGRAVTVAEVRFTPRSGRKYYAARAVCRIDKEIRLPIGTEFYDSDDTLFEKYSYTNVKLNAGLSPKDFSRENDEYRF